MYSSLHNHSDFSKLDSICKVEEMLKRASDVGLNAIALTDHGTCAGFLDFEKASEKYPDVKPIYGCELYECFDKQIKDKDNKYFHLIALIRDEEGRIGLNKIVTKSNFEGFYFKPRCEINDIKPYAEHLVITSACMASKLSRENDFEKCIEYINEYKSVFPYFYLEMQSHGNLEQCSYNQKILELAKITDTPFIITTDSHSDTKENLKYQSYLVAIGRNTTGYDKESIENSEVYQDCYIQSEEEIYNIMTPQIGYENVKKALDNTNYIANELIKEVKMPFQEPQMPDFPLPEGFNDNDEYLRYLTYEGWKRRGFDKFDAEKQKIYRDRLEYELSVIKKMGFAGYFLITADFLNECEKLGVEKNVGRGSAGGSLVCYSIGITDIDSIKFNLHFERFLNEERVGLPDIDNDVNSREIIIDYLIQKYGKENVCLVANHIFITPTVAIMDIGKILGFNYGVMQKLGQKFTSDKWDECMALNPTLLLDNPQYAELFDICSHVCGRLKTCGVHAGGVVVSSQNIDNFMPQQASSDGVYHVVQATKKWVESIGLIKIDVLGLSNLDLIRECKNDLGLSEWELDINNPEFANDKATYDLIASGYTNGVFQIESAGMKDLAMRLKVNNIDDLSVLIALYRPASMGLLEDYVLAKVKGIVPKLIHPDMKEILENTCGILVFQEQLMSIVRKFGNRTYGGADLFRKGCSKKNDELIQKECDKLYNEILANGYDEEVARKVTNYLREMSKYLFNSAHSYAYAITCLRTAYLKAHYTEYFYKALLNMSRDKAGAINKYILEAKHFNVTVVPPNINHSEMNFTVDPNTKEILFGLSAISGIGESIAKQIIDERNANGRFKSFADFMQRVKLTKAQVIALVKSGAIPTKNGDKMSFLKGYLESLYEPLKWSEVASLPTYQKLITEWGIDIEKYELESKGKRKVYDKDALLVEYNRLKKTKFDVEQKERFYKYIRDNKKYIENEEFWEFETLQIFIKDNPFEKSYELMSQTFEEVENGLDCSIVGIISKVQKKKDKNGKQFAYANIYSSFGLVEALIWHSQLKEYEDLVKKGQKVAILCKKEAEDKVTVKEIKSYEQWLSDIQEIKKIS